MTYEVAVPFNVGADGRVDTVSAPSKQTDQHVMALINTSFTERVMEPNYGVDTDSLIFSDLSPEHVAQLAANSVDEAVGEWEPTVEVISVTPNVTVSVDEVVFLDVVYKLLDTNKSLSTSSLNTAIIGADGTVTQVMNL